MGIIEERTIAFPETIYPRESSFVIERFSVPECMRDIQLSVQCSSHQINLMLVYDSQYNLRAEIDRIKDINKLRISIQDIETTIGAKSGPIPAGEWLLAIEIQAKGLEENSEGNQCLFMVTGNSIQ